MPYEARQISPRKWEVINTETGKVHSTGTSKKKAMAQVRLLYGVESGDWKPTNKNVDNKKGKGMAKKGAWITFWASKSKGKKFSSKEERHAFMQKCLSEWRGKKGTGAPLLLQPGLGQTTSAYTYGI